MSSKILLLKLRGEKFVNALMKYCSVNWELLYLNDVVCLCLSFV